MERPEHGFEHTVKNIYTYLSGAWIPREVLEVVVSLH